MKTSSFSRYMLVGLAGLVLSTGGYAASKGSMHISSPLNVAGEHLASGDYTVQWVGAGSNVELNIMKGKKVLATTTAVVKTLHDVSANDAVVVTDDGNGDKWLSQIFFSGKSFILEIVKPPSVARIDDGN